MSLLSKKIERAVSNYSLELQTRIEELISTRQLTKGHFLLEEGDICRNCFIMESGIARKYLVSNSKEITTELYFSDDIMVSLASFSQQHPSKEWIQVLTDSVVHQLNFREFQQLKNEYPELIELDLIITEHYSIWMEQKLIDFRTESATRRYSKLIENHPHFIQHIPLTIIASYLGIALETLSRIRSKF